MHTEFAIRNIIRNRPDENVAAEGGVSDMLDLLRVRYMEEIDLLQDDIRSEMHNFSQCRQESGEWYQQLSIHLKKIDERASKIVVKLTSGLLPTNTDIADRSDHIIYVIKTKLLDYIEDVILFSGAPVSACFEILFVSCFMYLLR